MKLGIMVTVKGMKMVQIRMKYISFFPRKSKNTKLYAARTPVKSLKMVTKAATTKVLMVMRIKGILARTPA